MLQSMELIAIQSDRCLYHISWIWWILHGLGHMKDMSQTVAWNTIAMLGDEVLYRSEG
jgi:hypothetical protein